MFVHCRSTDVAYVRTPNPAYSSISEIWIAFPDFAFGRGAHDVRVPFILCTHSLVSPYSLRSFGIPALPFIKLHFSTRLLSRTEPSEIMRGRFCTVEQIVFGIWWFTCCIAGR